VGSRLVLYPFPALLGSGRFIHFAADITVASPVNGTTVPSPVWVRAHTWDATVWRHLFDNPFDK